MTRDGVIFGVVTSIDCEEDEDAAKAMFDAPFSCRFRIDEGALIVNDLKCHEGVTKDDTWNGRFRAVGAITARRPTTSTSALVPAGTWNNPVLLPNRINPPTGPATDEQIIWNFWTGYSR
jgi:hypothetical protein